MGRPDDAEIELDDDDDGYINDWETVPSTLSTSAMPAFCLIEQPGLSSLMMNVFPNFYFIFVSLMEILKILIVVENKEKSHMPLI